MDNRKIKKFILLLTILAVGLVVSACIAQKSHTQNEANTNISPTNSPAPSPTPTPDVLPVTSPSPKPTTMNPPADNSVISAPIKNAQERVTKKPFGIKISPKDSPVSPERFSGYHTGVDFETFSDEQDIDVPIYAICDGALILKKIATGYGGVAVQSCKIENQDVTVVYGHLKLSSIVAKTNQTLKQDEEIGILGKGFSIETDGERKHLHLGIHKGKTTTLLGYVQKSEDLNIWIDVMPLLKK